MRDSLRSFDSKITFFAFADIITAVSGMLIFITLLLATDLGQSNDTAPSTEDPALKQRLEEAITQQAEIDSQNQRLEELLSAAENAPAAEKLEADIARLRAQLAEEKNKHAEVAETLAASRAAIEARDRTLGLTDLKAKIRQAIQAAEDLARQETKIREEMASLEKRVTSAQSKVLKLRQLEGNVWLIPDKSSTTKEPLLAIVSRGGATIARFDQTNQTREFTAAGARAGFDKYLTQAKPLDQYIVFYVRPSGIDLFERLVKLARDRGFEVGFDAVDEKTDVHYSNRPSLDEPTIPIIDETTPPKPTSAPREMMPGSGGYSDRTGASGNAKGNIGNATANSGQKANGNAGNSNRGATRPGDSQREAGFGAGKGTNKGPSGSADQPSSAAPGSNESSSQDIGKTNTSSTPTPARAASSSKSWLRRLLEWIGLM
jgi:hypothetical protein